MYLWGNHCVLVLALSLPWSTHNREVAKTYKDYLLKLWPLQLRLPSQFSNKTWIVNVRKGKCFDYRNLYTRVVNETLTYLNSESQSYKEYPFQHIKSKI